MFAPIKTSSAPSLVWPASSLSSRAVPGRNPRHQRGRQKESQHKVGSFARPALSSSLPRDKKSDCKRQRQNPQRPRQLDDHRNFQRLRAVPTGCTDDRACVMNRQRAPQTKLTLRQVKRVSKLRKQKQRSGIEENTVIRENAMSADEAPITDATAAIALPPQIAVPALTKRDVVRSTRSSFSQSNPKSDRSGNSKRRVPDPCRPTRSTTPSSCSRPDPPPPLAKSRAPSAWSAPQTDFPKPETDRARAQAPAQLSATKQSPDRSQSKDERFHEFPGCVSPLWPIVSQAAVVFGNECDTPQTSPF